MARKSTVTFAQVAQIADTMKAAGNHPSARAVRERLGTGSMGTIHKLLQQWAGKSTSQGDEDDEGPELPSSIASVLMDFVSTQVAEACEPLAEQIKSAEEASQELAEENERLTRIIEDLEEQARAQEIQAATSRASEAATLDQLRTTDQEAKELRQENQALRQSLDRMEQKNERAGSTPDTKRKACRRAGQYHQG